MPLVEDNAAEGLRRKAKAVHSIYAPPARAEEQPRHLHGIVHLTRIDANMFEEGEIKRRVVDDETCSVERAQRVRSGLHNIDHQRLVAAGIERAEPDLAGMRRQRRALRPVLEFGLKRQELVCNSRKLSIGLG
jgi:hypothetical protein